LPRQSAFHRPHPSQWPPRCAKASTQNIATDWQLNTKLNGWMQLVILEPSHMQTTKANFSVNCGK
jgi:hypothetical protein